MPGSGKSTVVKTEDEDDLLLRLRMILDTKSGEVGIAFSAKDEAIFNAFKASIKLLQNSDRSRKLLNFKKEGMARDSEARWVTSFYKTNDVLTELPAAAIAILRSAFNGNKLVVSYSFTDTNGKGLSDSDISKCNAKIAKALKAAAAAEEEDGTDTGEEDNGSDGASSTAGSTAAAAAAAHTNTEEVEQILGEQNEFLGEQLAILDDSIRKAVAKEIAPAVKELPAVTKEVKALASKMEAFGKVSTTIQKELAVLQAALDRLSSADAGASASSSSSSSSASPSKEVPSGVAAEGGSKEAKSLTPSKRAASTASASRPVRSGRAAAAKPSM